jgi:hypothetical protein
MPQNPFNAPIGLKYAHISGAATTVVKASPGLLQSLVINSAASRTVTLYDNTAASGSEIAVLTLPAITTTGLTIVTAAAIDMTVIYR